MVFLSFRGLFDVVVWRVCCEKFSFRIEGCFVFWFVNVESSYVLDEDLEDGCDEDGDD